MHCIWGIFEYDTHLCCYSALAECEACFELRFSVNAELPWIPAVDHCLDIAETNTMAMYSAEKSIWMNLFSALVRRPTLTSIGTHESTCTNYTHLTGIVNTCAWLSSMHATLIRLHAIWRSNCSCIHGKCLGRLLVWWRWLALNGHNGIVSASVRVWVNIFESFALCSGLPLHKVIL